MDHLPLELTTCIAGYLDVDSLRSYALTSSRYREACRPHIWRHITIPSKLSYIAKHFKLLRANIGYIQSLRIINIREFDSARPDCERGFEQPIDLGDWQDDIQRMRNADTFNLYQSDDYLLLQYVKSAPALTYVIWSVAQYLPSDEMTNLLDETGRKLHLWWTDAPQELGESVEDSRWLAEITSLHSFELYGREACNEHIEELVEELLIRSPNLRRLTLARYGPDPRGAASVCQSSTLERLHKRGAPLTELAFDNFTNSFTLRSCSELIDLNALRLLRMPDMSLEDTQWLFGSDIVNLEDLELSDYMNVDSDAAIRYLARQTRLQSLALEPMLCTEHLPRVIAACGKNLRKLDCTGTSVDNEELRSILTHCAQLQHLGIGVGRQQGTDSDAVTYRTFGTLRQLRHLVLRIRTGQWDGYTLPEGLEPPFEGSTYQNRAYFALRDSTMDCSLAETMFEMISKSKAPYTPPFERLQLLCDTGLVGSFISPRFERIRRHVVRPITCETLLRDDKQHKCQVSDTSDSSRNRLSSSELAELADSVLGPVLQKLWPAEPGQTWYDAWHSFPVV